MGFTKIEVKCNLHIEKSINLPGEDFESRMLVWDGFWLSEGVDEVRAAVDNKIAIFLLANLAVLGFC